MSALHFHASTAPPHVGTLHSHGLDFSDTADDDNLLRGPPSSDAFIAMLAAFQPSGGLVPSAEVERWLQERPGSSAVSFLGWVGRGDVFCFEWQGLQWVPMFQFNSFDLSLSQASQQVRAALSPELDAWETAAWFARPHAWLYGVRPVDLLGRNLTSVLQAARRDRDAVLPTQGDLL